MFEAEDVLRQLLESCAYNFYCCLIGHQAPVFSKAYLRLTNPLIGDYVMEKSTVFYKEGDGGISRSNCIGKLLRVVYEPYEEGDEHMQKVTYIETLDGREVRWVNCEFIALPVTPSLGGWEEMSS